MRRRKITTVLVAADVDEASKATIRVAEEFAIRSGTRVVVTHVVKAVAGDEYPFLVEDLGERLKATAEESLQEIIRDDRDDLEIAVDVRRGSEFSEIVHALRDHGAQLLVFGSPSYRGPGGGSLASELAQKVECNLLIVRPEGSFPGNIGVAVDFSAHAKFAAQRAIDLAVLYEVPEVTLMHVYDVPPRTYLAGVDEETARKHVLERVEAKWSFLLNQLETKDVKLVLQLGEGSPREKIPEMCVANGIDLLVAGCQGETDAAEMLLGSLAKRLLSADRYSVWYERPSGRTRRFLDAIRQLMHPDES